MHSPPRFFDADGNEIITPSKPVGELVQIIELGGDFDETADILSVYSEELSREEVSSLLEVQPTKAWNPGEKHAVGTGRSGKTRIIDWGKWMLEVERNHEPVEPKIHNLLRSCTKNLEAWRTVSAKYNTQLTIVAHVENWNRELNLSPETLRLLAERNLMLNVDIYFYGDDDDES